MKDYYHILEIQVNASEEDIKRAYKKLALKYHPDKNQSPEAEGQFKEVGEAFEVLSDLSRRREYDLTRSRNPGGCAANNCHTFIFSYHGNPLSTFAQFFGSLHPFPAAAPPPPPAVFMPGHLPLVGVPPPPPPFLTPPLHLAPVPRPPVLHLVPPPPPPVLMYPAPGGLMQTAPVPGQPQFVFYNS